jgi:hypothetical protein
MFVQSPDGHPGVVNEDVDSAEVIEGGHRQPFYTRLVSDIGIQHVGFAAGFPNRPDDIGLAVAVKPIYALRGKVIDYHAGPARAEYFGVRPAQAAAAASNERDATVESQITQRVFDLLIRSWFPFRVRRRGNGPGSR